MKFTVYEKRVAVVALYECGQTTKQIQKMLKRLLVNKRFIFQTLQRYREIDDVVDRLRKGRPRTVRTPNVIHAIHERVRRNPIRKQKRLSAKMNVSRHSISRILCDDLHLGAYHRCVSHILTDRFKKIHFDRCKKLLKCFAKKEHRKILFSDEKIFSIEEKFNPQNDHVYVRNCYEAKEKAPRVQHAHHPPLFIVWCGVSYFGTTEIHFCESGVKTNGAVYRKMLQDIVEPLSDTLFEGVEDWCFQQDSAPPPTKLKQRRNGSKIFCQISSQWNNGVQGARTLTPWITDFGLT